MKKLRAFIIVAVIVLPFARTNAVASEIDQLLARMKAGPTTNLYPEPIEKALSGIRYDVEKIVYVFREAVAAKADDDGSKIVAGYLARALDEHYRELCRLYTKSLTRARATGAARAFERLRACLDTPPLEEDLAAFLPVIERLPEDMALELAGYDDDIRGQAGRIARDAAYRDAYVLKARATMDFYRKKMPWHRLKDLFKKGIDGLLDRLALKFRLEELIRFFDRLERKTSLGLVRDNAARAREHLLETLAEKLVTDLDDRIEGGLGRKVMSIELTADGSLMTKSALYQGRLRTFVKYIKNLRGDDLRLFMDTLDTLARHVKRQAVSDRVDHDARRYLEEIAKNLDTQKTIYGLRLHGIGGASGESEFPLFDAVRRSLVEMDEEHIFEGIAD